MQGCVVDVDVRARLGERLGVSDESLASIRHTGPFFFVPTKKKFWGYPHYVIQNSGASILTHFGQLSATLDRLGSVLGHFCPFRALRDPTSESFFCLRKKYLDKKRVSHGVPCGRRTGVAPGTKAVGVLEDGRCAGEDGSAV